MRVRSFYFIFLILVSIILFGGHPAAAHPLSLSKLVRNGSRRTLLQIAPLAFRFLGSQSMQGVKPRILTETKVSFDFERESPSEKIFWKIASPILSYSTISSSFEKRYRRTVSHVDLKIDLNDDDLDLWLNSDEGSPWLKSKEGNEWMNSYQGWNWLITRAKKGHVFDFVKLNSEITSSEEVSYSTEQKDQAIYLISRKSLKLLLHRNLLASQSLVQVCRNQINSFYISGMMSLLIENKEYSLLLNFDEDEISGLSIFNHDSDRTWIDLLCTRYGKRGRLGARFLKVIESKKLSPSRIIELKASNYSLGFYEKQGYFETDFLKQKYTKDLRNNWVEDVCFFIDLCRQRHESMIGKCLKS